MHMVNLLATHTPVGAGMPGGVPLTGHHADVHGSVSSPLVGISASACGVNLPSAAIMKSS